jgi:hypothetical protein
MATLMIPTTIHPVSPWGLKAAQMNRMPKKIRMAAMM